MAAAAGAVNWHALKSRISALYKPDTGGDSGGKANVYPALRLPERTLRSPPRLNKLFL